jgi:hypothetical protein
MKENTYLYEVYYRANGKLAGYNTIRGTSETVKVDSSLGKFWYATRIGN